ncbi:MAG: hypothetical protein ACK5IC_00515 [Moheibacter sp.]
MASHQVCKVKNIEGRNPRYFSLRFAIREGGRTVGAGQVTEILD